MSDRIDRILALIDEGLLEHPTQRSEPVPFGSIELLHASEDLLLSCDDGSWSTIATGGGTITFTYNRLTPAESGMYARRGPDTDHDSPVTAPRHND